MLGVTDYGTFVVTVIVFLLIPGPGNLALITSTSKGGIVGGLGATLGVILGDQVLMWSAVAGDSPGWRPGTLPGRVVLDRVFCFGRMERKERRGACADRQCGWPC